jgi:NAD(P)-dependent dehydrogenase (short-subunit alcohol dehydrogenase family)
MTTNPAQVPDLTGRTLLVTGAGAGLGEALALAAGQAGAEVILLGRSVRKLESVHDRILADGGPQPAILPLDLEGATPDDYHDIAERIDDQCGRLDALIHNAAITGPLTPLEQYPPLEWMRVMQVNLNAPALLTQACIPLLRKAPSPKVLFIGDRRAQAYWGAYGVAKTGLDALAKMLDQELTGRRPVRVETFYPGPMRTQMRVRNFPGALPDEARPVEPVAAELLALLAE